MTKSELIFALTNIEDNENLIFFHNAMNREGEEDECSCSVTRIISEKMYEKEQKEQELRVNMRALGYHVRDKKHIKEYLFDCIKNKKEKYKIKSAWKQLKQDKRYIRLTKKRIKRLTKEIMKDKEKEP